MPILVETSITAERVLDQVHRDLMQGKSQQALQGIEALRKNHAGDMLRLGPTLVLRGDYVVACLAQRLDTNSREQLRLRTGEVHVSTPLLNEIDFSVSNTDATISLERADQLWRNSNISAAQRIWALFDASNLDQVEDANGDWQLRILNAELTRNILTRRMLSDLIVGNRHSAERNRMRLQQMRAEAETESREIDAVLNRFEELRADYERRSSMYSPWDDSIKQAVKNSRIDLTHFDWTTELSEIAGSVSGADVQIIDETLIVQDARGVRALNPLTGKSRWPVSDDDAGYLYQDKPVPTAALHDSNTPKGIQQNHRWIAQTTASTLHAFDLAAEGLLVFKFPDDVSPENADQRLTALCALNSERFIVSMYNNVTQLTQLACFDSSTSQQIWKTETGTLLTPRSPEQSNDQLAIGLEEVFYNINGAAVACVESASGQLRWVRGLDLQSKPEVSGPKEIQYHHEQVLAMSSGHLTALDPNTGNRIWKTRLPKDIDQILGASDVTVVVSGHQLWGLDRETGEISWRVGFETPSSFGFGRGLILDKTVFWPTREELWSVDVHSGRLLQKDFLKVLTGDGGGNLLLHGNQLFISDDRGLRVFRTIRSGSF